MTSGQMQSEDGPIPILMAFAAERGDPTGFLFVQAFNAGQSPVFSTPDGKIYPARTQENVFRHAPPHQMGNDEKGALLINDAFKRFAIRLMKRAFDEPEPMVSAISVVIVGGKIEGEASFFYVHGESGTMMKVTFTEEDNVFVLGEAVKVDDQGKISNLEDELMAPILRSYQD